MKEVPRQCAYNKDMTSSPIERSEKITNRNKCEISGCYDGDCEEYHLLVIPFSLVEEFWTHSDTTFRIEKTKQLAYFAFCLLYLFSGPEVGDSMCLQNVVNFYQTIRRHITGSTSRVLGAVGKYRLFDRINVELDSN
jgi:hypothetical protein